MWKFPETTQNESVQAANFTVKNNQISRYFDSFLSPRYNSQGTLEGNDA
jgi:hypothetical protein